MDELDALGEAQSIQSRLDGGLELITRYRGRASRNLVGFVVGERAPRAARTLEACGPRRVYVSGTMRLPLWFAIGRDLPDVRQWTLSLDQHGQEWQTSPLVREVGRLLSIYGANGSFRGYASDLLRFVSLGGGPRHCPASAATRSGPMPREG
ncbi:MAG TPA: hypothetical protein VG253_07170 [Streptosporangiaceae bacterium]|nr:hypothetical protein [Streptosporangiaceae bacterium]